MQRQQLVYRWDLDKTYLRTEFDTLRDLVRTFFEPVAEKKTVPGATALLREIQATKPRALCILSGSPEQMRRALEAKLRLDGIQWDEFRLKPSLDNLLRGRIQFLRDQVGYKLLGLLSSRVQFAGDTQEILFGDDAEADAFVYSLYADVCVGAVSTDELNKVFALAKINDNTRALLLDHAERCRGTHVVDRIFVNLERVSDPEAFYAFGSRVCPIFNYFQCSVVLVELDALDAAAALRVAAELVIHQNFNASALVASVHDLAKRQQVTRQTAKRLIDALNEAAPGTFAGAALTLIEFSQRLNQIIDIFPDQLAPYCPVVNYPAMYQRERERARKAKQRVLRRLRIA